MKSSFSRPPRRALCPGRLRGKHALEDASGMPEALSEWVNGRVEGWICREDSNDDWGLND
jgi:hypothetical protein